MRVYEGVRNWLESELEFWVNLQSRLLIILEEREES